MAKSFRHLETEVQDLAVLVRKARERLSEVAVKAKEMEAATKKKGQVPPKEVKAANQAPGPVRQAW